MRFLRNKRKVVVVGLDSASPHLLFNKFLGDLPNLKKMVSGGNAGSLRTVYPPITIPAWMAMMTGKDSGELGVYGFRHRKPGSYKDYWIAASNTIKAKKVWDCLAEKGLKSIVVGVPPSYPPYPINGSIISDFITPSTQSDYTYPKSLKKEIEEQVGEYPFDVAFRTDKREELLEKLYDMTEKHFCVIEYLMREKEWDFFAFVEIGLDRLHHAFWKYFDQEHHLFEPNHKFAKVIPDYYEYLDEKIGRLVKLAPKNTTFFVVSDHGVKRMKGAFCVNEWLIREGFLVLNRYPSEPTAFDKLDVNWEKTYAWAWGGYYARVFINKQGREPLGAVSESEYESFRDKLAEMFKLLTGPNGEEWKTIVHMPDKLYDNPQGEYSDLMVYFDDLYYRSAGTVGHKSLFLSENDTGPDDAMHDWYGIFVRFNSMEEKNTQQQRGDYNILEVCPMILDEFSRS